jgi:acetylornithine deacetylase/succinyl-diaminopimelate desuccinylase-like protein
MISGKLLVSLVFTGVLSSVSAWAQETPAAAGHAWRVAHQDELLKEFVALLAIPNVQADQAGLQRNAGVLVAMLEKRGAAAQELKLAGSPPVVFGEIKTPGATHTIVFYSHYDGQPVTPSEWTTPPFTPTFKEVKGEQRVYARSAGDDKAAIFDELTALDALHAAKIPLRANIKFVWDGEEEAGSPHFPQIMSQHQELMRGDIVLVCDGPMDQSGKQNLLFGIRGDTHLSLTVYGPNHGLHSGHYGNWAPNPALMLVKLLAGMKDDDGKVLIPHFYDGIVPLGELEKAAIAAAPNNDKALMAELYLGHTEGGGRPLLELLNLPTLNINGISSGQTGPNANNIIPPTATAELDMRLVVGSDWRQQQQHVIDYIRAQGYFVTDKDPTPQELLTHAKVAKVVATLGSFNATRAPMDLPIAQEVIAALKAARGTVIALPTSGASGNLTPLEQAAGAHTISVPIANHDDNQHAANENLRIQNLWDGIETMAELLAIR